MSRPSIRSVDSLQRAAAKGEPCAKQLLAQIKRSARDGETSGRPTDEESPLPAGPTIPIGDQADALEQVDNGRRLALAMEQELMRIAEAPAPEPTSGPDFDLGVELLSIEAQLIRVGARIPLSDEEPHHWLNALVNGVDALRNLLAERGAS